MAMPTAAADGLGLIERRRSVRAYTPQTLDRETVLRLLRAAVRAPTAVHAEPWAFVVVQDKAALKRLSDRAKTLFVESLHRSPADGGRLALERFAEPEFNLFYDAGTLIVVCGNLSGPFVAADCWLAAENLMLAACAMGLGTCVIGSAVPGLNTDEIKAELGIPPEMAAVAPIVVGVLASDPPATPRKEPRILAWK